MSNKKEACDFRISFHIHCDCGLIVETILRSIDNTIWTIQSAYFDVY